MKTLSIDERLERTRFESDDQHPHIIINKEACRSCDHRACTTCCPAERYTWDSVNDILSFGHVGCLECGNCRYVCERLYQGIDGYSWNYPTDGMGVVFREG